MFIGIDLSHSAPQSISERQQQVECRVPTFIGMAYTVGDPVKMLGTWWMQKSRIYHVCKLKDRVRDALLKYRNIVQKFPRHLIVYRSGVSEGEFDTIKEKEASAFREAFAELEHSMKGFKQPELTIVVVQRQSNYRIVPTKTDPRARPVEQNVRAGTVVDRVVMHPSFTEFLIVPHRAIKGTAQPARCTVVHESKVGLMPKKQLENVTNMMSYAHAIVTSPVSVPAPLYAAVECSKRAHNDWKTMSNETSIRVDALPTEDIYFDMMSAKLEPKFDTKFWA